MADGRLFKNRKYAVTRPRIVRPDYMYNMASRRAGLSALAELLVYPLDALPCGVCLSICAYAHVRHMLVLCLND